MESSVEMYMHKDFTHVSLCSLSQEGPGAVSTRDTQPWVSDSISHYKEPELLRDTASAWAGAFPARRSAPSAGVLEGTRGDGGACDRTQDTG